VYLWIKEFVRLKLKKCLSMCQGDLGTTLVLTSFSPYNGSVQSRVTPPQSDVNVGQTFVHIDTEDFIDEFDGRRAEDEDAARTLRLLSSTLQEVLQEVREVRRELRELKERERRLSSNDDHRENGGW
jgi:hypothetical protein